MEVDIRRATRDDYAAACAILDEVDALHRDRLPAMFQRPPGSVRELTYWLGLLADDNYAVFMASIDDQLVGVLIAVLRDTPPIPLLVPRRLAVVDTVAVRHSARRRGVGRALMAAAAEWAKARGATSMQLEVYEFNQPALAFYEDLGYETVSRRLARTLPGRKGESS